MAANEGDVICDPSCLENLPETSFHKACIVFSTYTYTLHIVYCFQKLLYGSGYRCTADAYIYKKIIVHLKKCSGNPVDLLPLSVSRNSRPICVGVTEADELASAGAMVARQTSNAYTKSGGCGFESHVGC